MLFSKLQCHQFHLVINSFIIMSMNIIMIIIMMMIIESFTPLFPLLLGVDRSRLIPITQFSACFTIIYIVVIILISHKNHKKSLYREIYSYLLRGNYASEKINRCLLTQHWLNPFSDLMIIN